jgi:hypothetical protein
MCWTYVVQLIDNQGVTIGIIHWKSTTYVDGAPRLGVTRWQSTTYRGSQVVDAQGVAGEADLTAQVYDTVP